MSHRISTRYTAIFPFAHPFHQYFFHYLPVPRSLAFSPLPSLLLASFFSHGIPRHTAAICHPHENFLRAALRPYTFTYHPPKRLLQILKELLPVLTSGVARQS